MKEKVLSYAEFCEQSSKAGLDDVPDRGDGSQWFIGYCPVMWDGGIEFDPEEADDCKEVGPFQASDLSEAQWLVRHAFGNFAEVDRI